MEFLPTGFGDRRKRLGTGITPKMATWVNGTFLITDYQPTNRASNPGVLLLSTAVVNLAQKGELDKGEWCQAAKDMIEDTVATRLADIEALEGLRNILCDYRAAVAEIEDSDNWGGEGAEGDTPKLQMANLDSLVSTLLWIIKLGEVTSYHEYLMLIYSINSLMGKKISKNGIQGTLRLATNLNLAKLAKKISPNTNIHLPPHILNYTRLQDMVGAICSVSAVFLTSVNRPLYSPRYILHAARNRGPMISFLAQL